MHPMFPGLQMHGSSRDYISWSCYPLQPKPSHPASGFKLGVSATLDWDWWIMQGSESPPASLLIVPCKGQPRCPTAAPASTLGTIRCTARHGCTSVDTTEPNQGIQNTKNPCLRFFPEPAHFPVAFLLLESCHLLFQDCLALPMLLVGIVRIKPFVIPWVWMKCRERKRLE